MAETVNEQPADQRFSRRAFGAELIKAGGAATIGGVLGYGIGHLLYDDESDPPDRPLNVSHEELGHLSPSQRAAIEQSPYWSLVGAEKTPEGVTVLHLRHQQHDVIVTLLSNHQVLVMGTVPPEEQIRESRDSIQSVMNDLDRRSAAEYVAMDHRSRHQLKLMTGITGAMIGTVGLATVNFKQDMQQMQAKRARSAQPEPADSQPTEPAAAPDGTEG